MKKTLVGPGGIKLVLDSSEVYPEDPGNGTPAMVYFKKWSATHGCAMDTGELDGGEYTLNPAQMRWIESDAVLAEVDAIYEVR